MVANSEKRLTSAIVKPRGSQKPAGSCTAAAAAGTTKENGLKPKSSGIPVSRSSGPAGWTSKSQ